jgi:hypothetical protein
MGVTNRTVMRCQPILVFNKVGKYHIHYCPKYSDNKYVVVASSDI